MLYPGLVACVFSSPSETRCPAVSYLVDPLTSCFQWYLHVFLPSVSRSWELMGGGDWSLQSTVALASEIRPAK